MKYAVCLIFVMLNFVAPELMASTKLHGVEQSISDSVITTKINAKLAKKGEMNPFKLHVSTKHGVVTLKGYVRDKKMFVDVLRLVKSTQGVRGVRISHLKMQQINMPFTDAYITAKAEAAVLKAKVFDDESIPLVGVNARTINGTVVLSGFVKRRQSIPLIVNRVSKIHGVKRVDSKLKVAVR